MEWVPTTTTTTTTMIWSYGPLVRTRNTITAVAYLSIRGTAKVSTIACHTRVNIYKYIYVCVHAHIDVVSTLPLDPFPSLALVSLYFSFFFFRSTLSLSPSRFLRPFSLPTRDTSGGSMLDGGEWPRIPSTSITREIARADRIHFEGSVRGGEKKLNRTWTQDLDMPNLETRGERLLSPMCWWSRRVNVDSTCFLLFIFFLIIYRSQFLFDFWWLTMDT